MKGKGLNVISFELIEVLDGRYNSRPLIDFISGLSDQLKLFPERLGYGTSLGAYGVAAHANNLSLDRVLLADPISSYRPTLTPFDLTLPKGEAATKHRLEATLDGADLLATGYVVYDPFSPRDRKHAARLNRLTHLRLPCVGHGGTLASLRELGEFDWLFDSFISGDIDSDTFHLKARRRRELPQYYQLMHLLNKRKSGTRREIVAEQRHCYLGRPTITSEQARNLVTVALELEKLDIEASYMLLQVASRLLPSDPLVSKKFSIYRQIVRETQLKLKFG